MINKGLSKSAQRALELAQNEAKNMNHNVLGTEHILLGIIKENEGLAGEILRSKGMKYEDIKNKVLNITGTGRAQANYLNVSPRTKTIFELAGQFARQLNQSLIGTEHILLGIMAEGEGVASLILKKEGINPKEIQQKIMNSLNEGDSGEVYSKAPQGKKDKKMKNLEKYGKNLNNLAEQDKLDPVIGREKEIQRVIQVLSRRTKNNPVLIGEPGVGKTSIAEGLAQEIQAGNVPELLKDKKVITLDLSGMVAGSKFRGEFEERLKNTMEEIKEDGNIILFIDEMHTIIGAGGAEGAIDASNILKPALSKGEIQAVGATTIDEYKKHIEKDAALERRFQPVLVEEPSVEDTVAILKGLRDKYEAHHKVKITDEAIEAAAKLSYRYVADRFLPDKAIDLIDEASSKARLKQSTAPSDLNKLEKELEELKKQKEEAINTQNFEKAAEYRDKEKKVKEKLEEKRKNWDEKKSSREGSITEEDIANIVSSWTGVPVEKMDTTESDKLLHLEDTLHKRVIGQHEAVDSVSRAIRRARVGLKDPKKPIGSFIFLGPTGVGKTELTKALAEAIFGDEEALIRIDMSEYMEKHSVSKLVGSPPGYVGFDEGGQLTEKVRRKPYSVILFDEIEKAHPDVFNILLQLLDDGRLTDSKGRTVNFKNTLIIMTSNVGANTIRKQNVLGFSTSQEDEEKDEYENMKKNVMDKLKDTFRPEFLNRLDEVIVFHSLTKKDIKEIVNLMIKNLQNRLEELGMTIEVGEDAKMFLAEEGYDPTFGARPLQRTIRKRIEDALSEEILRGTVKKSDSIMVTFDEDKKELVIESKEEVTN